MEIGALLSAVSVVLGIAGFLIGRLSASKADGKQDGVAVGAHGRSGGRMAGMGAADRRDGRV